MADKDEKAVGGAERAAKDTALKAEQQDLEQDQEKGWEEEVKRRAEREAQGEEQRKKEEHRKRQVEEEHRAEQEQLVKPAMTFFFLFFLWCGSNFAYSPEARGALYDTRSKCS